MCARFDASERIPSSFDDNHSRYRGLQHNCSLSPRTTNSNCKTQNPTKPHLKTNHDGPCSDLPVCSSISTIVANPNILSDASSRPDTPLSSLNTPPTSPGPGPGPSLKLLPHLSPGSSVEPLTPISPTDHIILQPFEPQDATEAAILYDLAFATSEARYVMQDPSKVEEERTMRAASFEQACTMSITRLVKAVDMSASGKIVGAAGFFVAGGLQWMMSTPPDGDRTDFSAVVAEEREKVLRGDYNMWELAQLFVHPNYQRHGIGKQLVEWGLQQADAEGLPVYVEGSAAGKGLYERVGFTSVKAVSLPRADGEVYKRYIMIRPARDATSVETSK
ncbi:acyl-CoA N-acyltransferase [Dothidotthia symphoricarpi CBS 119687]|uniref:Acyl-CoA N-acyltransferase n=1 Tax=Dothidotthia symphoricarpi CBS 119687 TaxID=1392245 RepID=A0A6A6AS19_9PLEO|nr:acyl-CoA N-acyltransferase [Dothidotthia symphoricarpi CBS 119687]KAF2133948.1 acyl-CoA N-acyltransferase [Dothidotthia symphoricarpi CBS 119687]